MPGKSDVIFFFTLGNSTVSETMGNETWMESAGAVIVMNDYQLPTTMNVYSAHLDDFKPQHLSTSQPYFAVVLASMMKTVINDCYNATSGSNAYSECNKSCSGGKRELKIEVTPKIKHCVDPKLDCNEEPCPSDQVNTNQIASPHTRPPEGAEGSPGNDENNNSKSTPAWAIAVIATLCVISAKRRRDRMRQSTTATTASAQSETETRGPPMVSVTKLNESEMSRLMKTDTKTGNTYCTVMNSRTDMSSIGKQYKKKRKSVSSSTHTPKTTKMKKKMIDLVK